MRQFARISRQVGKLNPGDNRTAISADGEDDEAKDDRHWLPLFYFERGYEECLSGDLGKLVFEGLNKLVKCLVSGSGAIMASAVSAHLSEKPYADPPCGRQAAWMMLPR